MIRPNGAKRLQRGVIIFPSAFTLGNLFLGMWAIVMAERGDLTWAAWLIVLAAITDNIDGRVARFTRTGSAFGSELDSLVDAISFGVAPAFLLFKSYFSAGWGWLLPLTYLAAVVIRLARFNVLQGGRAKLLFVGLPSPIAGPLLATFYPFSQTPWVRAHFASLNLPHIVAGLTIGVSVLMLSTVPYPAMPRVSPRNWIGRGHLAWLSIGTALAITVPRYSFFLALALYAVLGLGRSVFLGLLDRLPDRDPLEDRAEDEPEETRVLDYGELGPQGHDEGGNRRQGHGATAAELTSPGSSPGD
ncbi:MAG: CDP-diacylglycerol--serine O-phosphatidyltransferase [Gemmatimonadales bacterium]